MVGLFEGKGRAPWKKPDVSDEAIFLERLRDITKPEEQIESEKEEIIDNEENEFARIDYLHRQGSCLRPSSWLERLSYEGIEGAKGNSRAVTR